MRSILYKIIIATGLDNFAAKQSNQDLWSKFVPWNKYYSKKHHKQITRNGVQYLVRPYDYVQWRLFAQKDDLSTFACLDSLPEDKKNPGLILDIGSNCGHFSLRLAKRLVDQGYENKKIIAFEPNPEIYRCIVDNLSLNPDLEKIVHIEPIALSDESGISTLIIPEVNSGAASLLSIGGFKKTKEVEVNTTTLDNYLKNKILPKVDFIKLDVEGMEDRVLSGAKQVLGEDAPDIYLEVNPLWKGEKERSNITYTLLKDRYDFWMERDPNSGKSKLEKFKSSFFKTEPALFNLWARKKSAI